ncbi:MAG: proline--tRNA ligase [Dehalococcoidia bacterium]|nr:proline--tRNA ligase [Chloroflexi bacterium CFX7]NUQ54985.1 proline--tRNA ligase [Dehalococcoidia bacterium]RIL04126.1 MAG: proline--tRNA ligase [bacterium]
MRMSKLLLKTLREPPADAELPSHRLLLRAGLVMPLAAGLYCFTPLGWRTVRRIEAIIREEMDRSGAQEIHLPALHPIELWEQSGRAEAMGQTLFRLADRKERGFALGPTHEEAVSFLASRSIQSYRDLPVTLYQIQTKFRDEARPRGGLIRLREFIMKDAYSFDAGWEALDESYQLAFEAYVRIFARAGVPVIPVAADSGAIGGKDSQEFVFLSEMGEDEVLLCPGCGYAANAEKAEFQPPPPLPGDAAPLEKVATPGQKTIAGLAAFLGVERRQTCKAVFYRVDGRPVFVAIRGDLDVNETKLKNLLKAREIEPLDDVAARAVGLVPGSAGPVGLTGLEIVADASVTGAPNLVAGANEDGQHYRNVNHGRDWSAGAIADLALARAGDACLNCGAALETRRGIEMGHVFKLGTVYAESMGVSYLDEKGERQPVVMGCYGIGLERMLAAAIEANHDENGITWPPEVAPYDVHIVALNLDQAPVAEALAALEAALAEAGLSALIDDRDDSAGIKFKDADLLGMPVRITVSPRALEKGGVEFRARRTGETRIVALRELAGEVVAALRGARV